MTYKKIQFLLSFLLVLPFCLLSEHKIVYLISPPRSLSTAFLRMMEARGDFTIINEPSIKPFNKNKNYIDFYDHAPTNFDDIKEKIFTASETSNVFIKEISRPLLYFLKNDKDLSCKENIYFVVLVRNPHHSIISMYRKVKSCFNGFSELIGYKATYELLQLIQNTYCNKPLIIRSEDLYEKPEQTIKKFCDHVGLEFKKESLHWQDLGDDFTGINEWHETKEKHHTYHWHEDAIKSSGFTTPHSYATDEFARPTFEEITNEKDRKYCQKAYFENLEYYNLIINEIPISE
jgi:hypothetical protein